MSKTLIFLEKRGSLDVLFELSKGAKSFNDLESIALSPNTILARVREGQDLRIIEEKLFRDKSGRSKIKYVLTSKGNELLMASKSIQKDYLRLRAEIAKLEKKSREKENKIKNLLSSLQSSNASISISKSEIRSRGNIVIKAETKTENRIKESKK